jgi:hypothetical protein
MSREFFERYKPKDETVVLLEHIIKIIDDYAGQGLTLTLRQLYYQLVSKDLIRNEEKQYKRVGEIVSRARRGGWLDWDALEDRVRRPNSPPEYKDLDELINAALNSYRLPRLNGQESYVELWVEKDALAGVLYPIANRYHITLMVNRGYSSTSAMKDAGERLRSVCKEMSVDKAYVLYLGDLDPSGEDMVRDVGERLHEYVNSGWLFTYAEVDGKPKTVAEKEYDRNKRLDPHIDVMVRKLALTMDQVEEHEPPPNPAKKTDSRFAKFQEEHGDESWEVDALPPSVLRDIIENELDELIDQEKVDEIKAQEEKDKKLLVAAVASLRKKRK